MTPFWAISAIVAVHVAFWSGAWFAAAASGCDFERGKSKIAKVAIAGNLIIYAVCVAGWWATS